MYRGHVVVLLVALTYIISGLHDKRTHTYLTVVPTVIFCTLTLVLLISQIFT